MLKMYAMFIFLAMPDAPNVQYAFDVPLFKNKQECHKFSKTQNKQDIQFVLDTMREDNPYVKREHILFVCKPVTILPTGD